MIGTLERCITQDTVNIIQTLLCQTRTHIKKFSTRIILYKYKSNCKHMNYFTIH